jgi:hypothetical protein
MLNRMTRKFAIIYTGMDGLENCSKFRRSIAAGRLV